jgi:hypothetical protein
MVNFLKLVVNTKITKIHISVQFSEYTKTILKEISHIYFSNLTILSISNTGIDNMEAFTYLNCPFL